MAQIFANTGGRGVEVEREVLRPDPSSPTARGSMMILVLVLLVQAAFFFYVSQHRLVDDDEGYYLLASRLVIEHKTPYLDFFFQQAPLLPYVFAAWFKLAGISWVSARVFCALLSTLVGALVFPWFPIVKTFALAMLFLFPAYMICARLSHATPSWHVAAAGALFALA